MTINYYVSKTGNDSNDGLTPGTAWLTINKALTTVPTAGGANVVVGPGTYDENSGSGFLSVSQSFTSEVVFSCVDSTRAIIRGVSGTRSVFYTGSNIRWENFEFQSSNSGNSSGMINFSGSPANNTFVRCLFRWSHLASSAWYIIGLGSPTSVTNLTFTDCDLLGSGPVAGAFLNNCNGVQFIRTRIRCGTTGTATFAVRAQPTCQNLSFNDCELTGTIAFNQSAALSQATRYSFTKTKFFGRTFAALFSGGSSGNLLTLVLDDCDGLSSLTGQGFVAQSFVNATVTNCRSNAGNQAFAFPGDGAYSNCTAAIDNCTGTAHDPSAGHGILIGDGGVNCIVTNCTANGRAGLFGIVLKGTGHYVAGNTIYGGSLDAVYLKGCASSVVRTNKIVQSVAGGYAIEVIDQVIDSTNNLIANNEVTCTNGFALLVEAGVGAGNVFDANEYIVRGSGQWGSVLGTSVTSLATLRSAWSSYNADNDRYSVDLFKAVSQDSLIDTEIRINNNIMRLQ